MTDSADSVQDRIQFMQVVDVLEQGQAQTLPADMLERYRLRGWLAGAPGAMQLTDEGRREYEKARRERQATD